MSIDRLVANNQRFAETFDQGALGPTPRLEVAVVTCMDARLVSSFLGVTEGDVHIIRNAGAVVTEDVERSLLVSQQALGTSEIMLIGHSGCGMEGLDVAAIEDAVEAAGAPPIDLRAFDVVEAEVRRGCDRLRSHPALGGIVRGFVYDVTTGRLSEVA